MKEQSKGFNHYVEENVNLKNKIKELKIANQTPTKTRPTQENTQTNDIREYHDKQVDTSDLKANSSLYLDKYVNSGISFTSPNTMRTKLNG